MGYTHYWDFKRRLTDHEWESVKSASQQIIDMSGVRLGDGNGEHWPVVTNTEIFLNGYGDQAHETFYVKRHPNSMSHFCKTNRKPYDIVVVAILEYMECLVPDAISVSSDGSHDERKHGINLAKQVDLSLEAK